MKLIKKIAFLLSALMVCSVINISTSANGFDTIATNGIAPFYQSARRVENSVSISSNTAECTSICTGMSNVISISVEHTLQNYWGLWIWNDVDGASWSATESGSSICFVSKKSGLSSGKYRLKSVFTLTTSSGDTETITVYSTEKNVGQSHPIQQFKTASIDAKTLGE